MDRIGAVDPVAAPTRKTLRRLSSVMSDIWAALAELGRWGRILVATPNIASMRFREDPSNPIGRAHTSVASSGPRKASQSAHIQCRLGAVSSVECRHGCRDMPLYAAIRRSLERKSLIFLGLGFFFASQLRWRRASRGRTRGESTQGPNALVDQLDIAENPA